MRSPSPYVKAFVIAVLFALTILAGQYVRASAITHEAFAPNWLMVGAAGVLAFVADLAREKMGSGQ